MRSSPSLIVGTQHKPGLFIILDFGYLIQLMITRLFACCIHLHGITDFNCFVGWVSRPSGVLSKQAEHPTIIILKLCNAIFFSSPHPTSSHVNLRRTLLCSEFYSPTKLGGNTLDKSRDKSPKLGRATVSLDKKILLTR